MALERITTSRVLTRQQLAQFLTNPELIRAFEALSLDVSSVLPDAIEEQINELGIEIASSEARLNALAGVVSLLVAGVAILIDAPREEPVIPPPPEVEPVSELRAMVAQIIRRLDDLESAP